MRDNSHSNTPGNDTHPTNLLKNKVLFSRLKRKIFKHVWLVRLFLLAAVGLLLFFVFNLLSLGIKNSGIEYYLDLARVVFTASEADVSAIDGRTNILLLGKGGQGHEAPDLTDTVMVASVAFKNPRLTFVSLPRDIWIPELRAKLNSVYYWGNIKKQNGGILLAKSTVEKLLDEPIQYAVVLDFSGFKKIIDVFGGIEVDVEHEFTDEKFPIAGRENDLCGGDLEYLCRYETVSFRKGRQHMDGETALKFVRSRHAIGDEGTDIARSARQQKVISAVKDKVLSRETIFSKDKIQALIAAVEENIETDIDFKAGAVLARTNLHAGENIYSFVLPEEFYSNPTPSPQYDNLYVFIPKNGNWSQMHKWIDCVFTGVSNCN